MRPCQGRCRGFESHPPLHFLARIAQLAEQDTLNVKVPSSILGAGTTFFIVAQNPKGVTDEDHGILEQEGHDDRS